MGNRLSKIVTRTGDDGTTGLGDGTRLPKTAPRIAAIGTVDELNSHIGLMLAYQPPADLHALYTRIQHELFNLGGELAVPGFEMITQTHIVALEEALTALNSSLPPLKEFILPRGSLLNSQAHVARTVCRRAEREVWLTHETTPLRPEITQYLNRLSDLLFVTSRVLGKLEAAGEVSWAR